MALKYKSEHVNGFHGLGRLFSDLVRDSEEVLMGFLPSQLVVMYFATFSVFSARLHVVFWVSFPTCAFSGPEMGLI